VFRRRDPRPWWQSLLRALWPRGGWTRALHYLKHRIRRLPDTPERIARGIFAGVVTVFTPLFGLHFVLAALLAKLMRGNILASLVATFLGNPLTFLPIALLSLEVGHLMLGTRLEPGAEVGLMENFAGAFEDLRHNIGALFTREHADWRHLARFWREVFLPYLIGGIPIGIVSALIAYYVSVPLIRAYQAHRRGQLAAKLEALRCKAERAADERHRAR